MGSGGSAQVERASVEDLRTVAASLGAEELGKVKAALTQLRTAKRCRRRVRCGGQTFAPYGMRTDLPAEPTLTKDFNPYPKDELPEKVDLRKHMSQIEDQSNCNSCCANAVAGAYEYINQKHSEQTGDAAGDVSRLFIYYVGRKKDREEWGVIGGKSIKAKPKDEGMTISGAISAMQISGSCLAPSWPYDLEKLNERPPEECFKEAQRYRVTEACRVPVDVDMMRSVLAEGHPIVFGLLRLASKKYHYIPNIYPIVLEEDVLKQLFGKAHGEILPSGARRLHFDTFQDRSESGPTWLPRHVDGGLQ